jgi:hypothetical protein
MKIPLTVEYADGTTEDITPSPMAIIGWEKWSGRKMTDLTSDSGGIGMGDMVFMAWEQVRLSGRTTEEFDHWATSLADINPKENPEDPTSGDEEA